MCSISNYVTQIIETVIDIVFVGYPMRTSLGVLFGAVLKILAKVLSPIIKNITQIDIINLSYVEFIILSVALFHIKTFHSIITNKFSLSENEEKAFRLIQTTKKEGKITEFQAQDMYFDLCGKILANTQLKSSTKEEIQRHNSIIGY